MAKEYDLNKLSQMILKAVEATVATVPAMSPSQDPESKIRDLEEYDGRLKAIGSSKFGSPCYVCAVNFFANELDKSKEKNPKGFVVLYLEADNATKIFKPLGIAFQDDEDDASMIKATGELLNKIAQNIVGAMNASGYSQLLMTTPIGQRNHLSEGVAIDLGLQQLSEVSFFFYKHRSLVVEATFLA